MCRHTPYISPSSFSWYGNYKDGMYKENKRNVKEKFKFLSLKAENAEQSKGVALFVFDHHMEAAVRDPRFQDISPFHLLDPVHHRPIRLR